MVSISAKHLPAPEDLPAASQSGLLAPFHFRDGETLDTLSEDTPQVSAVNGCRDPYLATEAVKPPSCPCLLYFKL